eukprot:3388916-Rhodomonas_salina.1
MVPFEVLKAEPSAPAQVTQSADRNLATPWTCLDAGQCHLGIEHTRGRSPLPGGRQVHSSRSSAAERARLVLLAVEMSL